MKRHIRTELKKCKDCGHEFWSKYHPSEKTPRCGECGSRNVEILDIENKQKIR